MSHLPRDAYLVVKSRECPVVAGQWLGQNFQRYGLMEAQVSGAVYLPHATSAEKTGDAVSSRQDCAWDEPAFLER